MIRIAIVVSTVGYHWEELFAAYEVFAASGADIDLYTVNGGAPKPDPKSLEIAPMGQAFGLGISPDIAPGSPRGRALVTRLAQVRPISALDASWVDALYLPGGHGCLFDVNTNERLHARIAALYAQGAILSAVCHATSTFALTRVNGRSIVEGHRLTGFPAPLDTALVRLGLVHDAYVPLPLVNDTVLREAGARLTSLDVAEAMINPRTMRVSPPFITGVGPKSAAKVATHVIAALEAKRDIVEPTHRRMPVPA